MTHINREVNYYCKEVSIPKDIDSSLYRKVNNIFIDKDSGKIYKLYFTTEGSIKDCSCDIRANHFTTVFKPIEKYLYLATGALCPIVLGCVYLLKKKFWG